MKFQLKWHRQCLANAKASNSVRFERLKEMRAEWQKQEDAILFYTQQIEAAERLGKTSFDSERFMKTRAPKT